jgi:hypothetical protein
MITRFRLIVVLMLGLGLAVIPIRTEAITFSASSGDLSASVEFKQDGSNLLVTLTNTSLADVLIPKDVLTAVFFTLPGDPPVAHLC